MDILCSVCQHAISPDFVNRTKGLAYCGYCKNHLYLSGFLKRKENLIREERSYIGLRKPKGSTIEVRQSGNGAYIITVPGKRRYQKWKTLGLTLVVVPLCLGAIYYFSYLDYLEEGRMTNENILFIALFSIVALVMLLSFMSDYFDLNIFLTKSNISTKRRKIFGYTATKNRSMSDFVTARDYYDMDSEGGTSHGVRLHFMDDYSLEFAEDIRNESERRWLAGQFIDIRDQLTLAPEVRNDVDRKLAKAYQNPPIQRVVQNIQKVSIKRDTNKTTIVLPKENWKNETTLQLCSALFGLLMFTVASLKFWGVWESSGTSIVGKYVFSACAMGMFYVMVMVLLDLRFRCKTHIEITPNHITVLRKPFGFALQSKRQTKQWTDIETDKKHNFIKLLFSDDRPLRLGFLLKEQEVQWLVGELKWVKEGLG